ncbi:inhibitor of apoptosis repeat-containing protein [Imleria badia]|nr:inhibitor of apoptosis repeat-containing protein [Imleria badia]
MQSLQARIDSFQKTKRVKRYPGKASSSATSVKWPHPPDFKANANTLAEAGFFFSPSWDDRDSVACFLCGKELSDWDADDDPFEIHYTKCQSSCAWAVVRCGLTEDLDKKGCFVFANKKRLPSSKAMEKARLGTFGEDWWPHDGERGHGAASVKMAQAGFVYTPQAAGDDTVTCLYCNLSLGGWETEDDPVYGSYLPTPTTLLSLPQSGTPWAGQ